MRQVHPRAWKAGDDAIATRGAPSGGGDDEAGRRGGDDVTTARGHTWADDDPSTGPQIAGTLLSPLSPRPAAFRRSRCRPSPSSESPSQPHLPASQIPSHSRCHPRGHPRCHPRCSPHIPSLSLQFRPGPALTCPHTCCNPGPSASKCPAALAAAVAAALTLHPHSRQVPSPLPASSSDSRTKMCEYCGHDVGKHDGDDVGGVGTTTWGRGDDDVGTTTTTRRRDDATTTTTRKRRDETETTTRRRRDDYSSSSRDEEEATMRRRHSGGDECAGSRCITAASQVHQTGRRKCAGPGAGPVTRGRSCAAGPGARYGAARRSPAPQPSLTGLTAPPHSDSLG